MQFSIVTKCINIGIADESDCFAEIFTEETAATGQPTRQFRGSTEN